MEDMVEKIKKILLNDPEVKEKWEDLTHISSIADALKTFKLLFFFITKLVYVIEIIQVEYSGMTKEERIENAAQVLDDLIKFSGWAIFIEAFDYMIFKLVISQVVAALDDKYGSGSWFQNVAAAYEIDPDSKLSSAIKVEYVV